MGPVRQFAGQSAGEVSVKGFLHQPEGPSKRALVLTHGAGSNCQAPLLVALARAFCASGWTALRCDLPFRQARPHGPPTRDSGHQDQAGLRAAVQALRRKPEPDIYLGGHSYGGRQASMLAAAEPDIAQALLLLSYPLHPPQRPDVMRTGHLPALRTPALFVHGTADPFGSIPEMEQAIAMIPGRTELLVIPAAGHELAAARNRVEVAAQIAERFAAFVAR